jgi:hypothetical protein
LSDFIEYVDPVKMFTDEIDQKREYVGFVEAESLDDAFYKSQNLDEDINWNPTNPKRSTSVGDIIQDSKGFHLVEGVGFRKLE